MLMMLEESEKSFNAGEIMFNLLPCEILEDILCAPNLTYRDVVEFGKVCSRFREVSKGNKVWRKKYELRWPNLFKHYDHQQQYNWRDEFIDHYHCTVKLRKRIFKMSSQYYMQDEMSQDAFSSFLTVCDHKLSRYFLVEELEQMLHDGKQSDNLTNKYYAQRVLRYIRHEHLELAWKAFLSRPTSLQVLDKGAILLAQWCQPTECISKQSVLAKLDHLSQLVKTEVQIRYPQHPVLETEMVSIDVPLEKSLWPPLQCRAILNCLNIVMFNYLQFRGNRDDYYCAQNSYINKVLEQKTGIPITLCIIYSSVARRLGVVCHPVNSSSHFLLKWHEHPDLQEDQQYTYIDVFNGGKFIFQNDCKDLASGRFSNSGNWYDIAQPINVFRRMCWNLVNVGRQQESMGDGLACLRNALELLAILSPDEIDYRLLLARVYLHLNINLPKVMILLQEILALDQTSRPIVLYMTQIAQGQMTTQKKHQETRKINPKYRNENTNILYAVGMIMWHKKYKYTCVIYGWDPVCEASRDWIYHMGVHNLPNKEKQPFYNVLVDDGTNRYAAQENLEIPENPKPISHPEIGKYFQHYRVSHYMPNEEKEAEYPEDGPIRENIFHRNTQVI